MYVYFYKLYYVIFLHGEKICEVLRTEKKREDYYKEEIVTKLENVSKVKPAMPITTCTGAL